MLYLGQGLICSARRWEQENWLKRLFAVMAMTAIYRFRRREGARIAEIFYRRYHPFPRAGKRSQRRIILV
jgi:hypothetical protein